jgi:hypothetical protein
MILIGGQRSRTNAASFSPSILPGMSTPVKTGLIPACNLRTAIRLVSGASLKRDEALVLQLRCDRQKNTWLDNEHDYRSLGMRSLLVQTEVCSRALARAWYDIVHNCPLVSKF